MLKIAQYPRNADGTPMDLTVGVLVDQTGNGGARLVNQPVGPDGAPIDVMGLVFVDTAGNPITPNTLPLFRPESYGAVGDGVTNDTTAFQSASAAINAAGGGILELSAGKTYVVGRQAFTNDATAMYRGELIISIANCARGVIIRGNGARLLLAPGLRFGTFNAAGVKTVNAQPYYGNEYSMPIAGNGGIIQINNCTGGVQIENLELDGNFGNLNIGGPWGDTGWQLAGDGFVLWDNTGGEHLQNVLSHDFPRDGGMTWRAAANESVPVRISRYENCEFRQNWRQGFSLVGGRGYLFDNCRFKDTGRHANMIANGYSSPSAGIDMESESGPIRDLTFKNCTVVNNRGAGFLQVGDVAHINVYDTIFIGTDNWSIYGNGPYVRYYNCQISGAGLGQYGSPDPQKATQFHHCKFLFGDARSPTGTVYDAGVPYMWDGGSSNDQNFLFNNCIFDDEGSPCAGPWLGNTSGGAGSNEGGAIIRDCTFKISPSAPSMIAWCRFYGKNIFTGPIDGYALRNYGELIINGVQFYSRIIPPVTFTGGVGFQTGIQVTGDYYHINTRGLLLYYDVANARSQIYSLDPGVFDKPLWIRGSTVRIQGAFETELGIAMAVAGGAGASSAPPALDMGATYADTIGDRTKSKLRIYNGGGGSIYGLGVSNGHFEFHVPTISDYFSFYNVGNERFRVTASGAAVGILSNSVGLADGGLDIHNWNEYSTLGFWRQGVNYANITYGLGQMFHNVVTGGQYNFQINNVNAFQINANGTTVSGATAGMVINTRNSGVNWQMYNDLGIFRWHDGSTDRAQLSTTAFNLTGTVDLQFAGTTVPIRNVTAGRLIGRSSAGAGVAQEISLANGITMTTTTLGLGAITPTSVSATGDVVSTGGKVGYNTGAGGTVAQTTSKATTVTLNKSCGVITMNNAALAAGALVTFQVTNSQVAITDTINLSLVSGQATEGTYRYWIEKVAAGSFKVTVENRSAGSLSEALVFNFAVVKAVNA